MNIRDQEKTKLVLAFIERVESLSATIDPQVIAEGFDRPLKELIGEWVEDAKLYCANNEYGIALDMILYNLYEVDFRIDYPIAKLALIATYSIQPLNPTWIQIINELSQNQLAEEIQVIPRKEPTIKLEDWKPVKSAIREEVQQKELLKSSLVFSKDGTNLLNSFNDNVNVWDVRNKELRYQVSGELLGVSHKDNTFQTTVGTWDIDTEDRIESSLEFHDWEKRLSVLGRIIKSKFYLEVEDKSGIREPLLIYVGGEGRSGGHQRAWHVVDPNGRYVVVGLYISIMGHDFDRINCYNLNTGKEIYHFIDEDIDKYEIRFSGVHNLLFVKNKNKSSFGVYNFSAKQKLELDKIGQSIDGFTIRIHPKVADFAAVINRKRDVIFLGKIGQTLLRRMIRKTEQEILDIDFTPDGNHIAASLSNGEINIWDVNTSQLTQQLGPAQ